MGGGSSAIGAWVKAVDAAPPSQDEARDPSEAKHWVDEWPADGTGYDAKKITGWPSKDPAGVLVAPRAPGMARPAQGTAFRVPFFLCARS